MCNSGTNPPIIRPESRKAAKSSRNGAKVRKSAKSSRIVTFVKNLAQMPPFVEESGPVEAREKRNSCYSGPAGGEESDAK